MLYFLLTVLECFVYRLFIQYLLQLLIPATSEFLDPVDAHKRLREEREGDRIFLEVVLPRSSNREQRTENGE